MPELPPAVREETERVRVVQDKAAPRYDRQMNFFDRVLFADGREWACSRLRAAARSPAHMASSPVRGRSGWPPYLRRRLLECPAALGKIREWAPGAQGLPPIRSVALP